jgi:hypothetical protein
MAVELRGAFAGQLRVVPVFDVIGLAVERLNSPACAAFRAGPVE